jgi:hypothetical protein
MKNLTLKIVSGGQTGVDLGALKAAKKLESLRVVVYLKGVKRKTE